MDEDLLWIYADTDQSCSLHAVRFGTVEHKFQWELYPWSDNWWLARWTCCLDSNFQSVFLGLLSGIVFVQIIGVQLK